VPDDIAARRKGAESRCAGARGLIGNKMYPNAQAMVCLTGSSVSPYAAAPCERQLCRTICEKQDDRRCIQSLDYAEKVNPHTL
jgi:hypothetical protein